MNRSTLKSYQLGETLGVGTVGTIRQAFDRTNKRHVAVKILQPAVSQDETIRLRFEREIEVLQRLDHPNVIACFDSGLDDGRLFYSMEIVNGGTLKEILKQRSQLRIVDALEAGWQLCSALQHIHNHGVVHRDLKPSNIYLTQEGLVKLADFGIALDTGGSEITDQGLTVGSYQYMSPEQIRGDRAISSQTDLYALGCLLFELVTGHAPFQGTNFAQIFDQHLTQEPPSANEFVEDCPDELNDLIHCLMHKNPDDRPINARAVQGVLAEILSALLGPESVDAMKESHQSGSERLSRLVMQKRLPANDLSWKQFGAAAAAVVSLIALAALAKHFGS